MNPIVEKILSAYENQNFVLAQTVCEEYMDICKTAFMEELTVDTATNFVGSAILYSQLCSAEKKPWKAVPRLEDISGCVRFMEDFIQDRNILALTCSSVAAAFESAGFYPEAFNYFKKALVHGTDLDLLEKSAYSVLFFALRSHGDIAPDLHNAVEKKVGKEKLQLIAKEAREAVGKIIRWDPVEMNETFLKIRYSLEVEIDRALESAPCDGTPFCIRYWECKKKILREKYGIDWMSPQECNPDIRFA